MRRATRILIVGLAAAFTAAGCTVKKTNAPEVTGPSEMGTSLTLQAVPDVITQDGSSQSQVSILARDGTGQPIRNLGLRIEVTIGGVVADYGQLSSKNVVTGGDGRASVTYTAPPAPIVAIERLVTLQVVPSGTDYSNAVARTVDIRLVPPGVILPPSGTPTASFTFLPSSPAAHATVVFDASASTDSDGVIVGYAWSFGDGSTGSGMLAQHQYSGPGEYVVTLTVTDDQGMYASTSKAVKVSATDPPTAAFVYSPENPGLNQDIFFNGATSTAAPGRTIVDYAWNFGSGTPQRGMTVVKSYDVAGAYTVTLTVTDDVGSTATAAETVTVSASSTSGLFAKISYSPTSPRIGQDVVFDGADSYSPNGIATYEWEWGDGTRGAYGLSVRHQYTTAGTYVVRLTVTDTRGFKATTTTTVSVAAGSD